MARWLREVRADNTNGEYYLTDVVALARAGGGRVAAVEAPADELACINSRGELAPEVSIGPNVVLGPGVKVASGAQIRAFTHLEGCIVGPNCIMGPDARLPPGAELGEQVHVGTITCNYDGYNKHRTTIGARVFIGSDTALVAPVTVGDGAIVGAGSVITEDVPPDALALARGRQANKPGRAPAMRKELQGKRR